MLVASTAEKLAKGEGDLWDSGRVASDQSLNVAYAGKPLATSQRCHWKVRAWEAGASDAPSAWSAPARWIMGVVKPEDWKAKWIGANAATRPQADLAGAQWIWTGDAEGLDKAAAGKRWFRKTFEVAPAAGAGPAMLAITADDQHEVYINGQLAAKTWGLLNDWRWIRFIEVTKFIKPGRNRIAVQVTNEKPGPTGLLAILKLPGGAAVVTDGSWTSTAKAPKDWKEASDVAAGADWKAAVVAGPTDCAPWGRIERRIETASPAFEKTFEISKPVAQATLHITGVGFYEATSTACASATRCSTRHRRASTSACSTRPTTSPPACGPANTG